MRFIENERPDVIKIFIYYDLSLFKQNDRGILRKLLDLDYIKTHRDQNFKSLKPMNNLTVVLKIPSNKLPNLMDKDWDYRTKVFNY